MLHTELNFNRGKKRYKFSIVHNLDEIGSSIDAALINWSARTNQYTEQSFIQYIKSKDSYIIAMTKSQYDLLNSDTTDEPSVATKAE